MPGVAGGQRRPSGSRSAILLSLAMCAPTGLRGLRLGAMLDLPRSASPAYEVVCAVLPVQHCFHALEVVASAPGAHRLTCDRSESATVQHSQSRVARTDGSPRGTFVCQRQAPLARLTPEGKLRACPAPSRVNCYTSSRQLRGT